MKNIVQRGASLRPAPAVAALAVVVAVAAMGPPDDRAVSAGRWQVTSVEVNGKEIDRGFTDMLSVAYAADGTWVVLFKNIPAAEGTSTVDQATQPRSFELITLGSGEKNTTGRTYAGIYEMQDDIRRICFVLSDRQRPTEFRSTREGGEIVVTMRRAGA